MPTNVNTAAGSVRRLDNGKWQATVVVGEGRGAPKKTKTFDRRADAAAWLATIKGTGVATGAAAEQTVAEAFDHYIAAKVLRRRTVMSFTTVKGAAVAHGLGARKLKTVRPSEVVEFTAWLVKRGHLPGTVNLYATKLNAVLRFAGADGALMFTPKATKVAEPDVVVESITAADVRALYEAADEGFAPALLLMAFGGLRSSEACAVTVADVDFPRSELAVTKAVDLDANFVPTKTARSVRRVPLSPELVAMLAAATKGKTPGATLATTTYGKVISTSRFSRKFTEAAKAAGVECTSHALRKFYATTQLAEGVNPKAVARYLGDTIATMMKTYVLVQESDADRSRATMSKTIAAVLAAA